MVKYSHCSYEDKWYRETDYLYNIDMIDMHKFLQYIRLLYCLTHLLSQKLAKTLDINKIII